jgi:GNAT superfamily N-acetyltransferase
MSMMILNVSFRQDVRTSDRATVRNLVEATGFFSDDETAIALELVEERLAKSDASGYHFLFAEVDGASIGYACYGPVPATQCSYDIYWMAVHPNFQRRGLGRKLLVRIESLVRGQGGRQIYMDTSGRAQYEPTRRLYEVLGYRLAANLPDYYAPGDAKVIYEKVLS